MSFGAGARVFNFITLVDFSVLKEQMHHLFVMFLKSRSLQVNKRQLVQLHRGELQPHNQSECFFCLFVFGAKFKLKKKRTFPKKK